MYSAVSVILVENSMNHALVFWSIHTTMNNGIQRKDSIRENLLRSFGLVLKLATGLRP